MPEGKMAETLLLNPEKFRDPDITAKGEQRAVVALTTLRTVWFNTGSLCNITCQNCYMDSSPKNDRLAYLSADDVRSYLDEITAAKLPVQEIGFTGGEPFMNAVLPEILGEVLGRGFKALILTNAMKPMHHKRPALLELLDKHGEALSIRVSMDHYTEAKHEKIRGEETWEPMLDGLRWLAENGFKLAVAGRTCWDEDEDEARRRYGDLFRNENIPVDAADPASLVLFPEMDVHVDVPEITVSCWEILGVEPDTMMCATSRMIVKRQGEDRPVIVPCTLLPYDPAFDLGTDLAGASKVVKLNHPHCAKFCVLGGASCSVE
ncbi:MAG: radical SAM protein [Rhodospirillales bacterium]|nr:radical SAM protein [Rhodospirillales bacterium]